MHKTFFTFWDSTFIQVAWKYVSDVLFPFRNISEQYFQPRDQISLFLKKVGNALFAANLLTSPEYSTFSSQIVRYGQTNIGTLKSGPRRCFHIPIMLPYHLYISFSNSRKKFSFFHFYAYFLKGNFKELPEKLFSAPFQLFFHRILKIFLQCKTMSTCVLEMF